MKVKLFFLVVIVFVLGCGKKSFDGTTQAYYKQEINKSKEVKHSISKSQQKTTPQNKESVTYLSTEERKQFEALLEIEEGELKNEKLYNAIKPWLKTPYLWGGTTKRGVDCSSLVQQVYKNAYDKELPRTSIEQFYFDIKANFKGQQHLEQGDLIFFRLRHKDRVVSHVGIYLQNGKFLGSNSPHGVQITNLNTVYWQDKYVSSARLLNR